MSYQVLARKYRPATFHDVVGQEHAVRALIHALDHDRLHHAYMFTGTRGVGKTTIARIFAKCLNCEVGVSSTPCGKCATCLEIAEGRHVDLIEVDAASRTRVDDTRELLDNVQYLPTRGRHKVYLIDEVHMLSTSSFNALLKTLEEPPEHVKFLLATTDPKKVPITVLSRCLPVDLKNILAPVIVAHLEDVLARESIEFELAALEIIAVAAAGSMRDALSLADQAVAYGGGRLAETAVAELLGTVRRDEIAALLQALAAGDKRLLLQCSAELAERSADFATVLANLQRAFHDIAMTQAVGAAESSIGESFDNFAHSFSPEAVQLYYQIALMSGRDLQFSPDPRVGFEMGLIRMLQFEPAPVDDDAVPRRSPEAGSEPDAPASSRDAPSGGAREGTPEGTPEGLPEGTPASSTTGSAEVTEAAPPQAELKVAPRPSQPVLSPISGKQSVVAPLLAASDEYQPADPADDPRSSPGADAPWHEIVRQLEPTGVAKMILEHSELTVRTPGRWQLTLNQSHDTLLNDSQRSNIEALVTRLEDRPMRVTITSGETGETPADRAARIDAARKRAAQETLESDSNVRSLLTEFDARLDDVKSLAEND